MFKSKEDKKAYEKKWYQTIGREKRQLANKRWENKKIEEFKKIKSTLKCEICNESHIACLEFHHLDPSEKEGNVGQVARSFSTKRLMEEISKCIILCANCHRKEHYKEL
jgi:hypothetical protein